ncbi:MAG: hypothetical protein AB8G22_20015 [Saprospiraceae bacterium]
MTTIIKKVKRSNRYPEGLKRKLAKLYLSSYGSYAIIAEEYGLANKGVVKEFVKWYRRQPALIEPVAVMPNQHSSKESVDVAALLAENARLKAALATEQLHVEALETMIDIAEDQLQIPIRKKSGAKPSKK